MKKILIVSIVCCYTLIAAAQHKDLIYVDQRMSSIGWVPSSSSASIADFINQNFSSDEEKIRAAYYWVTSNITYDTDSMYAINSTLDATTKVTAAMRRRKGVCENFAAIFNDILLKTGQQSHVINGYTKQDARINKSGHTWCAVKLNDTWFFCDPTWDAGYRNEPKYFLHYPSEFNDVHMPFDPMWQLSTHPVTAYEFYNGIIHKNFGELVFNFNDSIRAFLLLKEFDQLKATAVRIEKTGVASELIKTQLAFVHMQIGINYEDKDVEFYNGAIKNLNSAFTFFNQFVQYRNALFQPIKRNEDLEGDLQNIGDLILAGIQKLDIIALSPVKWPMDTDLLRSRLINLSCRLQEQKLFLQKYFAEAPTNREKLFYTNNK